MAARLLIGRPALLAVPVCGLAIAAAGCGGGDTTTIIERTVTVEQEAPDPDPAGDNTSRAEQPGKSEAPAGPALLQSSGVASWYIEPVSYALGVSGSLVARNLAWSGWGSDVARAPAEIWHENPEVPNDYLKFPGELKVSRLEVCEDRLFYTEVTFLAEGFIEAAAGGSPCNGGGPFDPGAVITRAEDAAEFEGDY